MSNEQPMDRDAVLRRMDYALNATYELEKLARIMPELVPIDDQQSHFAIRGISARMLRLTSVLLACASLHRPADSYDESEIRSVLMIGDNPRG